MEEFNKKIELQPHFCYFCKKRITEQEYSSKEWIKNKNGTYTEEWMHNTCRYENGDIS